MAFTSGIDNFLQLFVNDINSKYKDSLSELRDIEKTMRLFPTADFVEYADKYMIICDIPGVNKSDIFIKLSDNILSIRGSRIIPDYPKIICTERDFGEFERRFQIPADINKSSISSKYENGILSIVIPRLETSEVEINVE